MADGTSVPLGIQAAARRGRGRRGTLYVLAHRRSTLAFLMALPLILLVLGLMVYPTCYAIYLSLLNRHMTAWEGLSNYSFLLARQTFRMVIWQSVFFAGTAVVLKAIIGFTLANLMHNVPSRRQRIWRGLLLVPWVIPEALSTLGWWWMFDPSYSAFNWVLAQLGLPQVSWLGHAWSARLCTVVVNTWYGMPFFMIMYLAALKSVPEQLYEAAAIDGAGWLQRMRFVTLPLMRNIISITMLFSLIVTLADFDVVRILTAGGPQNQTHIFSTYAFNVGIESGDIPLGAATSLFMLPILAVVAFFVLRGVTRRSREIMG